MIVRARRGVEVDEDAAALLGAEIGEVAHASIERARQDREEREEVVAVAGDRRGVEARGSWMIDPVSPCGPGRSERVRSQSAAPRGRSSGTVSTPAAVIRGGGVVWTMSIAWTSGIRPGSRGAWSAETRRSKGSASWAKAPRAAARTRARRVRRSSVGSNVIRTTTVLTKVPARASISASARPETGTPTVRSDWPVRRARSSAKPASTTVASVEEVARPSAASSAASGAGIVSGCEAACAEGPRADDRAEIERRDAVEARGPVAEQLGEAIARECGALPRRVIGGLERERRERAREAGSRGVVERGELGEQEAHRPAVGREVVEDEEERVIVLGEGDQIGAEERAFVEVEAVEGAAPGEGAEGGEAIGGEERVRLDLKSDRRVDPALWDAVHGGKRRPQGLVAEEERLERARERGAIEGAAKAEERGDVVRRVAGGELLGEPEALLGEGEREQRVAGGADEGRERRTMRSGERGLHAKREGGDRRRLEDGEERRSIRGRRGGARRGGRRRASGRRGRRSRSRGRRRRRRAARERGGDPGFDRAERARGAAAGGSGIGAAWRARRSIFPLGVSGS